MSHTFPWKLAAIDIDGTLLGPDSQVSSENVAAVSRLRGRGVHVMLASGRRHENTLRFHRLLGLHGLVISCQGAMVKNEDTGEVIHQICMPAALAAEVVSDGQAEGVTQLYYLAEGILIAERNSHTELYSSRGGDVLIVRGDLQKLAGQTPLKIIWMHDASRMASLHAKIHKRYRGRAETVVTYPEYLEFMAPGVNKAVGVEAAAKHYGVASHEILAFGDGDNDVAMLQWAGLGVAMSESTPAARAAAKMTAPTGDPGTSLARAIDGILA